MNMPVRPMLSSGLLIAALAFYVPSFAQTSPETAPPERSQTPESARDPQVMVPEKADDIDHTKEARDQAVRRGAVRSSRQPAPAERASPPPERAPGE
jgi:hypothetical protein